MLFGEINQAVFDWPWSVVHLVTGLLIGLTLISIRPTRPTRRFWLIGFAILILWEFIEVALRYFDVHAHEAIAPLKQAVGGFAFAPETMANILGDMLIGSAGLGLGRLLQSRR